MGRDILGGNGIADEYPIFRHMANLESVKNLRRIPRYLHGPIDG